MADAPDGAVLLMIPPLSEGVEGTRALAERTIRALAKLLAGDPRRPPILVAVPDSLPAAAVASLTTLGKESMGGGFAVRGHGRASMSDGYPVLLLVDRHGAIRYAHDFPPGLMRELRQEFLNWLRVLHRPQD